MAKPPDLETIIRIAKRIIGYFSRTPVRTLADDLPNTLPKPPVLDWAIRGRNGEIIGYRIQKEDNYRGWHEMIEKHGPFDQRLPTMVRKWHSEGQLPDNLW